MFFLFVEKMETFQILTYPIWSYFFFHPLCGGSPNILFPYLKTIDHFFTTYNNKTYYVMTLSIHVYLYKYIKRRAWQCIHVTWHLCYTTTIVQCAHKSCQLTKVKLACNKIWTRDLLLLYMTQLPSQPTFNHALNLDIITFVSFKCWVFLNIF